MCNEVTRDSTEHLLIRTEAAGAVVAMYKHTTMMQSTLSINFTALSTYTASDVHNTTSDVRAGIIFFSSSDYQQCNAL
jgi:hypothetical protein